MNQAEFQKGLDLFNRAHFFDAHEVLEDVWNTVPRHRRLRLHVQGMVQLAVAFHHQSTGNVVGAQSVLERALRNLRGADASFPEVDLERLRADVAPWQLYLAERAHPKAGSRSQNDAFSVEKHLMPALPKIMRRRGRTERAC